MMRVVRSRNRRQACDCGNGAATAQVQWPERTGGATAALVGLLLILLYGPSEAAADWPTYRHNQARIGHTSERLAVPLQLTWVYRSPTAPQPAWSGPRQRNIEGHILQPRVRFDDAIQVAAVGGRLFFGSSVDHQLHCLAADTGQELWTFYTGGPIRLAPTVSGGRVYFGSDDGSAYCLDAETGRLIWRRRAGPADEWLLARGRMISRWPVRTGVLVDGHVAYFGAGIFPHEDVYLYAVSADDGRIIWRRDNISQQGAGQEDFTPQGYLLANDRLLVVPSGRALPAVFDRRTGRLLFQRSVGWRREGGGPVGGTDALLADGQIYAAGEYHMLALDQKNGATGFGWFQARRMAVAGEAAYVASGKAVARLDRLAYAKASRQRHKLTLSAQDLAQALRGKKGEEAKKIRARLAQIRKQIAALAPVGVVWQKPCTATGALVVAGNLVLVGGQGQALAFDAETGEQVWQAEVAGTARGLAVADGALYVSTTSGAIYRFAAGVAAKQPAELPQRTAVSPYPQDQWSAVYERAAQEILRHSGLTRGFCLIVGCEQGRLAYELARRSDLKLYGVEPDEGKVQAARRALSAAGLYGTRVTVHQCDLSAIPYSNYFANLIVSDTLVRTGRLMADPARVARHLKPLGGVLCLGRPSGAPGEGPQPAELRQWLQRAGLGRQASIKAAGRWALLTRGPLPGAGSWTHQYAEPGNSACSDEQRVKGGLGVLWYGDPGPSKMINRHTGAVGPLAVNGRLFIEGQEELMAYDAYNGLLLWQRPKPDPRPVTVSRNVNPGNMAADAQRLFFMAGDKCYEFDAATGKQRAAHDLPPSLPSGQFRWGFLAYQDGLLVGTAKQRPQQQRRGQRGRGPRDAIFAIDTRTGKHLWVYHGRSIDHRTVALGPGRVFFIDSSITSRQREAVLRQDKSELKRLTGQARKWAEERLKKLDVRLAVALDAGSGKQLWAKPVDVTDCSGIGAGGGRLTMMYRDGVLVLCGANANGHYWQQFINGEFKRRRLVALSAKDGHKLWAKDANYRHRPIIVGPRLIAEPWAFDLYTGEQLRRSHPLTGASVPWTMFRPGHHCGGLSACEHLLLFRSGCTGFYDLDADAGVRHFAGQRLGCWINAIPANGLVMVPESSAGCICLFPITTTVVFEPRQPRRPWSICSAVGPTTPVRHMALNLGAPGDRRAADGTLWLAYPRPATRRGTGLDLELNVPTRFVKGGRFEDFNERTTPVAGFAEPWVLASWARGLTRCSIPLLGKSDRPAVYTVKLYFAELDEAVGPGQRLFDVRVQGRTVLQGIDVAKQAGGARRALVREVPNVTVKDKVVIELVARQSNPGVKQAPILNAVELIQTGPAVAAK